MAKLTKTVPYGGMLASFFVLLLIWLTSEKGSHPDADQESMQPLVELDESQLKRGSSQISSVDEVQQVTDSIQISELKVGNRFSFQTERDGETNSITLTVTDVSKNRSFSQFHARNNQGETAILTLTSTLTNILLKTTDTIFEYRGDQFDGIMREVARLDLSDDIHAPLPMEEPNENNFEPKRLMER